MANEHARVATDEEIAVIRKGITEVLNRERPIHSVPLTDWVPMLLDRIDADAKRIAELTTSRDAATGLALKRGERIAELEHAYEPAVVRGALLRDRFTGRDSDCPYCVRHIPDERCTCVPSVNAPFPSVDNSALAGEFDASVWAREFRRVNVACDEGTMLAWFATAIMSGYDYARNRCDAEIATLKAAKEQAELKLNEIAKAAEEVRVGSNGLAYRIFTIIGTEGK